MIVWLVDRTCHRITPQALDNLRKQLKEVHGFGHGLNANNSRVLGSVQGDATDGQDEQGELGRGGMPAI
eukprot:3075252-Alexandrium_andersonii.AAC.1